MNLDAQLIKRYVKVFNESISSAECVIVYFYLETSGLAATADILQIAVKSEENIFNVYINPNQAISPSASLITGLTSVAGQLHVHKKPVNTVDINDVLRRFQQFFTKIIRRKCLLVAFNARFDPPRLLRAILNSNVMDDFSVITGFADSLSLFRKALPERKGKWMFEISTIAKEYLDNSQKAWFKRLL